MTSPSPLLPIEGFGPTGAPSDGEPVLLVYEPTRHFGALFRSRWEGPLPRVIRAGTLKQCQEHVLRHRGALLLLEVGWGDLKSRLTLLAWIRRYRPGVRVIAVFADAMRLPAEKAERWKLALMESGATLVLLKSREIDVALSVARKHFQEVQSEQAPHPEVFRLPFPAFAPRAKR